MMIIMIIMTLVIVTGHHPGSTAEGETKGRDQVRGALFGRGGVGLVPRVPLVQVVSKLLLLQGGPVFPLEGSGGDHCRARAGGSRRRPRSSHPLVAGASTFFAVLVLQAIQGIVANAGGVGSAPRVRMDPSGMLQKGPAGGGGQGYDGNAGRTVGSASREGGAKGKGEGRSMCEGCARPTKVCLCDSLPNPRISTSRTRVLILQHPEETKESKGTVPLCTLSMDKDSCSVTIGRKFDRGNLPARVVAAADDRTRSGEEWNRTLLLWPSSGADGAPPEVLSSSSSTPGGILAEMTSGDAAGGGDYLVVLLDATWNSAQQMLNVSPILQSLRRVQIEPKDESKYTIRVQHEPHFRSTLESVAEVLGLTEGDAVRAALMAPLIKFVAMQEEFIQARGGQRVRKAQGDANQKSRKKDRADGQQRQQQQQHQQRPFEQPSAAASREAGGGTDEARCEYQHVRRNKTALLGFLVGLAQNIEREWSTEALRMERLELYRECLLQLQDEEDDDLRELGRLGPKMKHLDFDLTHFLKMALPVERKHSRGLKDHEFIVETDDKEDAVSYMATTKLPITVVLDSLRSAFNVGSVFRSSECLGVSKVFLCGYTATPEDQHTQRSSMGTDKFVDWEWRRSTVDTIRELKGQGLTVIALETVKGKPFAHQYSFPRAGCAIVLGNERHGLEADVLTECDTIVQIPCMGVKNSLNVAVAFGMCCYEVVRQWREQVPS